MSSKATLLTIAVPTYNRSRFLTHLLDSLQPQLRAAEEGGSSVELLISDNASSDGTEALLDEYERRGLNFRYFRNQTNIGPDANFAQCFEQARGRYVWIIGDDDILLAGGLSIVLDLLQKGEYDLVHLRAQTLGANREVASLSRSPRIEIIKSPRAFTRKTHVYLTFISGNIINKEWVSGQQHAPFSELIGTNLIQLGWTYTALRHFRKGAFVSDPILGAGAFERGGFALVAVFGTNLKRITEAWLCRPDLVRIVLHGTLQTFFPSYIFDMKLGDKAFAQDKYAELLHELFSDNWRFGFFLSPILKLPGAAGRLWLLLCRIVNRLDKATGNYMLEW